jgi:CPA2 family monovalent cation:H+ antiporter-2
MLMLAASDASGGLFIRDLFAVLATASAVAMLMQRVRLAAVPGYLIAGALLGPYAFRFVRDDENLSQISDLAILLLMFGIGLQLHLDVLKRQWPRLVTAGVVSCAATAGIGWPVAMAFRLPAPAALAVAMALSMSSTAVVLRVIAERRELHHAAGRLSLSILVIQDLLVLAMLAAMPAIARWHGTGGELIVGDEAARAGDWHDFIGDAALRVGGIAALIVFGRLVLPLILHESARSRSSEILMIVSIAAALAAAMTTSLLGFSPELGAFLAGFLLSSTPFRHHLQGQVGPLRDLFIAVFFTTLGMNVDAGILLDSWWVILLAGATMSFVKLTCISGTVWALGASAGLSVSVGLALAQAGEFSVVLLQDARGQGLLDDATLGLIVAIVIVSLVLTPGMVAVGRLAPRWLARAPGAPWFRAAPMDDHTAVRDPASTAPQRPLVIVAGFGPIGRRVADRLTADGFDASIIELNPATVRDETKRGRNMIYGDVAGEEVLREAGIERAAALVITVPDEDAALRACAAARRLSKGIVLVARTASADSAAAASRLGADYVVSEEDAAAHAMERVVCDRVSAARRREPVVIPEADSP